MSIAVLYHRNCRDGFASAAVADRYYKHLPDVPEVLYFGCDPSNLNKDLQAVLALPPETVIRSFDVGFKADAFKLLKDRFTNIKILDHHKTTAEEFPDEMPPEIHFENDHCGCVLAWKFYFPDDEIPLFLLYLQDRDLWKNTQKHSESINQGLYNLITYEYTENDMSRPIFTKWIEFMENSGIWYDEALKIGGLMVEQKQRDLTFMKRNARRVFFQPDPNVDVSYAVMLVNATSLISDLGNVLATENSKDAAFALLYRIVGHEVWFSLRSIGEFDTTVIAKQFGGGGHKNASGFSSTFDKVKITPTSISVELAESTIT